MSLKNASLSIKSSLLVTEAILIEIEANFVAPSFVLSLKFDIDLLFLNYGSLERQVTSFKENLCSCVMFTICWTMETVVGFCNSHNMSLYNFISQSPPTINAAASSITCR
ncbi:hypothetical protein BofuT4_P060280.1 [Botrytis cinerea T4]|uniref:Uncharacterized protein n=1 Tax=Botryotinia fuckeliana (strain T4) TaxID=999810 RepID=G2XUD9_BOTF4|nr:hypothetical protein BofuT4_P060280.1 [Botrytis cinerea T4]